jgi:hypothetical protein
MPRSAMVLSRSKSVLIKASFAPVWQTWQIHNKRPNNIVILAYEFEIHGRLPSIHNTLYQNSRLLIHEYEKERD